MYRGLLVSLAACSILVGANTASAAIEYSQGFETDTLGWNAAASRVGTGTNGIASADGSFHAQNTAQGGPFTGWRATATPADGYNFGAGDAVATSFQEYWTSIDIYLDVNAGYLNDSRLDFSSAINNAAGTHLQDFIFNGGFYNAADLGGPGAGTNRFVFSASNNSQPGSAFAKNPARDPIAITTTGWYTFEHHFFDDGGLLGIEMNIFDSANSLINTWSPGGGQAIAGVGGNRYGWFDYNKLPVLAFDNAELRTADTGVVPEAASLLTWAGIITCVGVAPRRRRNG